MKKAKEESLDLFYLNSNEKEKKNKKKVKTTKNPTKNKKNKQKELETKEETINLDNEIIIGLKQIPEPKKEKQKEHTKVNNKNKNTKKPTKTQVKKKKSKKVETKPKSKQTKPLTKKEEIAKQKRRIVFKFIKWTTLFAIIIAGVIYTMLSPIFNIKKITITGNSKISEQEITSLSGIKLEENTFNIKKQETISTIKQNAYIEAVTVKRKLPDEIEIIVKERVATYQLSFANAYVYLNNQGYLLEITNKKAELPFIIGFSTKEENIIEGGRLEKEDLEKLEEVLQIMKAAESSKVNNKITSINISNKENYILSLQSEKKTVELGNTSNLSTKMLWLTKFIEDEKGVEGKIILNIDLNKKYPYFQEKI